MTDQRAGADAVRHNHLTRDIKPPGRCPKCDEYHQRRAGEDGREWTVNSEEAVVLGDAAVRALAERLVAWQVSFGEWLEWEDVPMLSEGCFTALAAEVDTIGAQMWRALRVHDQASGIDSALLLHLAQDGPTPTDD